MPIRSEHGGVAPTLEEQFLRLVCLDEELLRAEFDAIITAEWPTPPIHGQGRAAAAAPTGKARHRRACRVGGLVTRPRHPGIGGWARQRSPPPATSP